MLKPMIICGGPHSAKSHLVKGIVNFYSPENVRHVFGNNSIKKLNGVKLCIVDECADAYEIESKIPAIMDNPGTAFVFITQQRIINSNDFFHIITL